MNLLPFLLNSLKRPPGWQETGQYSIFGDLDEFLNFYFFIFSSFSLSQCDLRELDFSLDYMSRTLDISQSAVIQTKETTII